MGYKSRMQWGLVAVAFFAIAPAQAEYDKWNGVIFSAERSVYTVEKPEFVIKSKVYYSKVGTRIERGEGLEKAISIVNFQEQKCWLIQPEKKIYYEVKLDPGTQQCNKLDITGFEPETEKPGLFFPRPCFGFKKMTALGDAYAGNRLITKWQCMEEDGSVNGQPAAQHWYDATLRMVIREVSSNGVAEGSKIKLSRVLQSSLLLPPPGYELRKTN